MLYETAAAAACMQRARDALQASGNAVSISGAVDASSAPGGVDGCDGSRASDNEAWGDVSEIQRMQALHAQKDRRADSVPRSARGAGLSARFARPDE